MCSSGWTGFKRATSVRPAAYDRRKMKKLRDAGPGRTKMVECNCSQYLHNVKSEDSADNYLPRIKSEDAEQAHMGRLPFGSRQPLTPTMMKAPRKASHPQISAPVRIKYDLSSSDASTTDSEDSGPSSSEYRPSKSPSPVGLTPAPTTRSKSTFGDENPTDRTSPPSGAESGSPQPKKHKHRSPKKKKAASRNVRAPTDGLFSPPPSSDVDADRPAIRSPKGKGKAVCYGRAKSHGVEQPRGRMFERNPDGSRARTRAGDSPKEDDCRVRKKKHKSKKDRNHDRLAREARIERSIDETPFPQMLTLEAESSPVAPASPASPVSPIPARFAAPIMEPATPGPSRPQRVPGATETPQSLCSLFVTQPRKRSTGKRTHHEFTVEPEFTVESLSQKFAQQCRPLFTEVVDKTEAIRTETEALKKKVKKTESDLNICTARLDAQSGQVRNIGHRYTEVEARVQTLEQQSVSSDSLGEYRREYQELRDAVNALRQQQQEENAQREKRIKQEISDELNSGFAKHKAEFTVDLAKHKAEQEEDRRLDCEQQAIADHERRKWFEAQHEKLSQTMHNSLRIESEARRNQMQHSKAKVAGIPVPVRPPAQEPPRVMHEPFIPEIRPPDFYGLAHRNGMNPPVPGTIPDTLVRAHSRPGHAQPFYSTLPGPSYDPSTWPIDQPSAQPTSHPPAGPAIHQSAQPPNQLRQDPATQPPARQRTQLPMRPNSHTHGHSPRRSPHRRLSGKSPAPRSNWKPINKRPMPLNSRSSGGGSASQQRGS